MLGVIDYIDVRAVGRNQWELLDAFDWYGITVPKGFVTDFGSIPGVFRGLINPVGVGRPAFLVHDWLYYNRGILADQPTYSRKECDRIFLTIMKA